MLYKLAILIPTLPKNKHMFELLVQDIQQQAAGYPVMIIKDDRVNESIGAKRNAMLEKAARLLVPYVAQMDDDDEPMAAYFPTIFAGIENDVDVVGLVGKMTTDGVNAKQFFHSLQYRDYYEHNGAYFRPPNHLNAMKTHLAMRVKFPELNFGEDTAWAMQHLALGTFKTEHPAIDPMYWYKYIRK